MQALLKTARAATANLDVPQLANLGRLLTSGSPAAATAKIQKALALAQRFDRVNKEASILDEQYNAKREALQAALTSHSGQEGAIRQDLAAVEQSIQSKTAQQQSAQRALEAVTGKAPPLSAEEMRMPAFPGVSGAARIALQTAYAQMGKPYVWGGSGPSSFDCSGLVRYSWHAAGVEMPHLASAQAQLFPKVPTSALQPGDLVYFGNPVHHVGMYIGNGKMINAPHPGDVVRTAPALQGDYVGGNRP
jgi:cell wall-associated NlpC family hydrolase